MRLHNSVGGRKYNSYDTDKKYVTEHSFLLFLLTRNCSRVSGCWSHSGGPILLPFDPCRILGDSIWLCSFIGNPLFQQWLTTLGCIYSLRSRPCQSTPAAPQQEALSSPLNVSREAPVTMGTILRRHSVLTILTFWPSIVKNHNSCSNVLN